MSSALIQCPACRAWLVSGPFNQPDFTPCPACAVPLQMEIFPALFRKMGVGQSAEAVMIDGETSCFYHPQKKAVVPCDGCGRFLCAVCDCLLESKHYCPACLEAGRTKSKIKSMEHQRTLYDNIALGLAVFPLVLVVFYYFTLVTAPMSLFVTIRYWSAPRSIVRRNRIRFILAIFVALATILGWAAVFTYLATRHGTRS